MPQFPWLNPAPFFFPGSGAEQLSAATGDSVVRGCMLIHGFTGAPAEMRPMGEYLAERGITVIGPRLAGHGTTAEDMASSTWQDWYASVEAAYQELSQHCQRMFVGGFSLGALLALHLAVQHEVGGLILMSPALQLRDRRASLAGLLRFFIKYMPKDLDPAHSDLADAEAYKRFWSYDVYPTAAIDQLLRLQRLVRTELRHIHCPILVIYSTRDLSISPQSGRIAYDGVASADKELLVLQRSGHGIVVDSECQTVFQTAYQWMLAH